MANANRTIQILLAVLAATAITNGTAKTTHHLQFYMHDTVTASAGSAPTTERVVRGATPLPGDPINRFGDMYVIDDPLTEGPDAASSRVVGRAQGFYLFASRSGDGAALLLSANMVFTAGEHNGSAVAVLARDAILDDVRELPVVGATGGLRGAVGYGLLRTHAFNASSNNAVLKIDMYLSV